MIKFLDKHFWKIFLIILVISWILVCCVGICEGPTHYSIVVDGVLFEDVTDVDVNRKSKEVSFNDKTTDCRRHLSYTNLEIHEKQD